MKFLNITLSRKIISKKESSYVRLISIIPKHRIHFPISINNISTATEPIHLLSSAQVIERASETAFYACLNKYTKCTQLLQTMLEQFNRYEYHNLLQHYTSIDYRPYTDTLSTLKDMIPRQKVQDIEDKHKRQAKSMLHTALGTRDKDNATPLQIASKYGTTKMISMLRGKVKEDLSLLIQVTNNDLSRSHLMDLCEASKKSDTKAIDYLISCGESINQKKTIFGTFPLLEAVKAYDGSSQAIRMLLRSGANVNEQDTNGWTIMHHASQLGMLNVIEQIFSLQQEGIIGTININKLSNKGYHVLHLAASHNHPHILKYFFNHNNIRLDPTIRDGQGCTILHHAAKKGSLQSMQVILQHHPSSITAVDHSHNTALHLAHNHPPCIQLLLYHDSDEMVLTQMRNSKGKLARDLCRVPFDNIFSAVKEGNINLTRTLINREPSLINATTFTKHRSLLILATIHQHLLIVKLLCSVNANTLLKDKDGKNALDHAIQGAKINKGVTSHNILQIIKNNNSQKNIQNSTQQSIDKKNNSIQ